VARAKSARHQSANAGELRRRERRVAASRKHLLDNAVDIGGESA
jgi:hypothetical protein